MAALPGSGLTMAMLSGAHSVMHPAVFSVFADEVTAWLRMSAHDRRLLETMLVQLSRDDVAGGAAGEC